MDIKRFVIITAAFTIFNLHAQAASCPTVITGSSSSTDTCDFDSGVSVTVANGGEVGGISMVGYIPGSPSSIVIDAGGLINISPDGSAGILMDNASLTNGITNNGSIIGQGGAAPFGISLVDSTVSGGITNNGIMSSDSSAYNLFVNQSTINGGITNTGSMTGGVAAAITIADGSTINGGFSNSGSIRGGGNDSGITINQSVINGNFTNTGSIVGGPDGGNALYFAGSSSLVGNLSNSGTIDGSTLGFGLANNSVIDGNLTNSGSILGTLAGLGVFYDGSVTGTITNTNLIRGGDYGINNSFGNMQGGISNSGIIRGGNSGIFTDGGYIASINNSGTIEGGDYGLQITNGSTINGALTNSGLIQGDTDAIYIQNGSSLNEIDIVGNGRVAGNVDAINSNFNLTSGVNFSSEGSFSVNNFNIESNAVFNMNNDISVQTAVNNSGLLNIGSSLRNITGNYNQNAGSSLQLGIINGSQYGQLAVSNAANLSQSGKLIVQVDPNSAIYSGEVFANIISGSNFTAPIGGTNLSSDSFLWNFSATTTANGIDLTAIANSQAAQVCQGDYCAGAANAIVNQVDAANSAFGNYGGLSSASAFKTAASQATPELTNENVQALQFETRSVMDVVPMWSNLHGESAGDAMIYEPGKWWLKPYGGSMSQDTDNTVPGFNADVYGSVLGRDTQLSDNSLFGGAIAFGRNNLTGKSELNTQAINSDDYQGMLYGTRLLPHNLYIAGQGLLGYESNDSSRAIPLYSSTAGGSFGAWFTNLRSQLGWNAYATQNLVITPNLDASYLYVNQNAYQESGSVMDLNVNSSNNSSLVLGAYTNAAYHLATSNNKQEITLSGYAGIAGDVLNSTPSVSSTFVAGGPSFSTFGAQFNSVVFRGGLGLNFQHPRQPLSLSLNYDLQAGNNAYSGVGSATLSYKL